MAPDPKRLELHALLVATLGSSNVYFQPPANLTMQYPCIVYKHDNAKTEFAGNHPYSRAKRYQVTVIDRNPDTLIPDDVAQLPLSNLNRTFTADNLHHYVFNLYYF
ncbi:tail terminator [Streptomyces phage Kardashian]|nr:tail terminator [Streptomyces phage Kardashian]